MLAVGGFRDGGQGMEDGMRCLNVQSPPSPQFWGSLVSGWVMMPLKLGVEESLIVW